MITQFENPPVQNRIRPFWFLNGHMKKEEIEYQIAEMKDKGLGGFVMCARQGMTVPYLSREWFDLCGYAVSCAERNGLEVWLYDEFPYPSGMSGGEVTLQNPQACQHELVFTDYITEGGRVSLRLGKARSLYAAAYPVENGRTLWQEAIDLRDCIGIIQPVEIYQYARTNEPVLNRKRYFSYGPEKELCWEAPKGSYRIITASAKKLEDFKYYGDFMDPANPEAVDTFLATTYEKYRQALGSQFGKTIKGIFGDETHFQGDYFWSFELPGYYREKYGEDIFPLLFGIWDRDFPEAAKIRYRYFQCMHELLRDRYHKKISEWCQKNHLSYATEIPVMRMSGQMYSHVPGGDPNHDKLGLPLAEAVDRDFVGLRSNTKVISAIARQYNRRDSLIESFHSIGWSMTLQDAKWQIDRETLMGASMHVFHAFYYTVNGIIKHDAPPSQFIQNPYWKHYKKLGDYCARSARFVAETEYAAQVALFHPMTSWWTSLINPMIRMKYTGMDREEEVQGKQLLSDYLYLCKTLLFHHVDYEDLDAETLAGAVIADGEIRVGRAVYRTVIVPPVKNLEGYGARLLKKFAESGGRVIFCGLTPYEKIDDFDFAEDWMEEGGDCQAQIFGSLSREAYFKGTGKAELLGGAFGIRYLSMPGGGEKSGAGKKLLEALEGAGPSWATLWTEEKNLGKIVSCQREDGECRYVFVTSCDGVEGLCRILTREKQFFYELDLETGQCKFSGFTDCLEFTIQPWETKLIALSASALQEQSLGLQGLQSKEKESGDVQSGEMPVLQPEAHDPVFVPTKKEMDVSIAGCNVLRLERFLLSLNGSPEFETFPETFVEQARAAKMTKYLDIDFSGGFGIPLRPRLCLPVSLIYRSIFFVDCMPSVLYLMHDEKAVMGDFQISINGTVLEPGRFGAKKCYDQNNLACSILEFVKPGKNELSIRVRAKEEWHGVSDPFYLLGDFGVLSRDSITEQKKRGFFNGSVPEGFPFYSGEITYAWEMKLSGKDVYLALPEEIPFFECASLYVDEKLAGTRAFAPYRWHIHREEAEEKICKLRLVVNNTLIHMLEGAAYDYERKEIVKYVSNAPGFQTLCSGECEAT